MSAKRVLFLGLGDPGSQVLDTLVHVAGTHQFLVGSRQVDAIRARTNGLEIAPLQEYGVQQGGDAAEGHREAAALGQRDAGVGEGDRQTMFFKGCAQWL